MRGPRSVSICQDAQARRQADAADAALKAIQSFSKGLAEGVSSAKVVESQPICNSLFDHLFKGAAKMVADVAALIVSDSVAELSKCVTKLEDVAGGSTGKSSWTENLQSTASYDDVVKHAQTTVFKISGKNLQALCDEVKKAMIGKFPFL